MACDQFPDIFTHLPKNASPQEINTTNTNNDAQQKLYTAVRFLLLNRFNYQGQLPDLTEDVECRGNDPAFPFFISVYGMLISDSFTDPSMNKTVSGSDDLRIPNATNDPAKAIIIARRFVDQVVQLVAEFQASSDLFTNVYKLLRELGTSTTATTNGNGTTAKPMPAAMQAARRTARPVAAATAAADPAPAPDPGTGGTTTGGGSTPTGGGSTPTGGGSTPTGGGSTPVTDDTPGVTVVARQLSEVSRRLVEEQASADDPQLKVRVTALLSVVLGDSISGRASAIEVDLPNLEDETQATILRDNVISCAPIYMAAMLEDYNMFRAAHTISDQFMQGMVPLSRGPGGNALYDFIRDTPNRFTEVERRTIYAQVLGLAQGSVEVQLPNREFADLWIRFLSAVSLNNRQNGAQFVNSRLVTTGALVTPEQVFKAAKDLAVNLSLHGYGIGYFAGIELQKLIRTVKTMLSFPDIIAAYGVRDIWQLVERVSQIYLGGSVNGVRQRTMAQTGANIIQFLADKAGVLSGALVNLDTTAINSDVERWLAVTGTDDNMVDKYSAPVAVTQQPTIPMTFGSGQGMELVRNALQQVGGMAPNLIPNLANGTMANLPKA
jgi:hypothetical protein